jgi:murein DD-endopeptidase MepM/ murein hydrolase activator NlpD
MRASVFIIAISSLFHSAGASYAAAEILPERILGSEVQREIVSPFFPVLSRASSVHFSLARGRGASPEFIWPVRGTVVFHMNDNSVYEGINIAAAQGTIVKVAADGVVVYSGKELRGYGQLIFIDHGYGWVTAYACNCRLLVERGNQLRQGQSIATMKRSGAMSFLQLHFEIGRWGKPLNTWNYLPKRIGRD